jgi:hypothetical protein
MPGDRRNCLDGEPTGWPVVYFLEQKNSSAKQKGKIERQGHEKMPKTWRLKDRLAGC